MPTLPKTLADTRSRLVPMLAACAVLGFAGAAKAEQIVQVPLDQTFLNGRTVTTLTAGALVPWTKGVDGGGTFSGYMTKAASTFHGDPEDLAALPDDGVFAGNARHPEVVLHFANAADAQSRQTHFVQGAGTFTFAVPPAIYSKLFLFATSAEGDSSLKVTLTHADANQVVNVVLPDYYANVAANDPVVFTLATNLPKWSKTHQVLEADHHNLTGIELLPKADQVLTSVTVEKAEKGYLVFWGATGIASSSVAGMGGQGGVGGSAGSSGAGASGGSTNSGSGGQLVGLGGGPTGGMPGSAGSSGGVAGGAMSGSSALSPGGGFHMQGLYVPESASGCSMRHAGRADGDAGWHGLWVLLVLALRRRASGLLGSVAFTKK